MTKRAGITVFMTMIACVCFPGAVFSESKDSGFYAGPLSVTAETVVEVTIKKVVPAKDPKKNQKNTREESFEEADSKSPINKG